MLKIPRMLRVDVNALDDEGHTPIQLALLQALNPLCNSRGNRSSFKLTQDRMDCVQFLLSTTSGAMKPDLLLLKTPGWTICSGYDLILNRFREDSNLLQVPRKELKQGKEIELYTKQFERTW